MPTYNVSLKKDADESHYEAAKKHVTDQGGKIVSEYKIIKGFTAEIPDDQVSTLQSNDQLNVELDGKVTTQ